VESRKRAPNIKDSSIEKKLDKLASDVKKLPPERQNKLKDLIGKRAYDTEDAAEQLGISVSTLRRFMSTGAISFFRVGNRIRFSSEEIERFGNNVSLKDAADILGVNSVTIRRLIKSGKLPATRIGRPYRIAVTDIEAIMLSEINVEDTGKRHKNSPENG